MSRPYLALAVLAASLALAIAPPPPSARAASLILQTDMFGSQEVPPIDSPGWGFVRFFFNNDRSEADYTVDVKGFSNTLVTGADIHRGRPGASGPVVRHLADGGFIVTSGRTRLSPADLDEMAAGLWYVSLKTSLHPEGELRGQIIPPPGFRPEPPPPEEPRPEPVEGPAAVPPPPPPPVAASQIRPPNTGDAGLAGHRQPPLGAALLASAVALGPGLCLARPRSRRRQPQQP